MGTAMEESPLPSMRDSAGRYGYCALSVMSVRSRTKIRTVRSVPHQELERGAPHVPLLSLGCSIRREEGSWL